MISFSQASFVCCLYLKGFHIQHAVSGFVQPLPHQRSHRWCEDLGPTLAEVCTNTNYSVRFREGKKKNKHGLHYTRKNKLRLYFQHSTFTFFITF